MFATGRRLLIHSPAVKLLVCAVLLLGSTAAHADDILAGGTYYYDAHLVGITADTAVIKHKGGSRTVTWASLSTGVQRQYAKQHEEAIRKQALDAQAKAETEKMQASGMRTLGGTVLSIVPNEGILLMPMGSPQAALLRGYDSKDLADGDAISPVVVVADGVYSYDVPRGPRVTVHAFKMVPKPAN